LNILSCLDPPSGGRNLLDGTASARCPSARWASCAPHHRVRVPSSTSCRTPSVQQNVELPLI